MRLLGVQDRTWPHCVETARVRCPLLCVQEPHDLFGTEYCGKFQGEVRNASGRQREPGAAVKHRVKSNADQARTTRPAGCCGSRR